MYRVGFCEACREFLVPRTFFRDLFFRRPLLSNVLEKGGLLIAEAGTSSGSRVAAHLLKPISIARDSSVAAYTESRFSGRTYHGEKKLVIFCEGVLDPPANVCLAIACIENVIPRNEIKRNEIASRRSMFRDI